MFSRRHALWFALSVAIPIEVLNLRFSTPPLDVDWPAGLPWWRNALTALWVWLHLPGLLLSRVFPYAGDRLWILMIVVGGYAETAGVILLLALVVRWAWMRRKDLRPPVS